MPEVIHNIVAQIEQVVFWFTVTGYFVIGVFVVWIIGFIRRNLGMDAVSIELRGIGRILESQSSRKYQFMDVESLEKQLQLMEILVDGCKKHPAYRAIRPATGYCEPCVKMWDARLELNKLKQRIV